jgi:hypothetical protein
MLPIEFARVSIYGAEREALGEEKGDRLLFLTALMPRIPRGQVAGHAYHVWQTAIAAMNGLEPTLQKRWSAI